VDTPYKNVSRLKGKRQAMSVSPRLCALKQDYTHTRRKFCIEFYFLIFRWLNHDWGMISKTDYMVKISRLRTVIVVYETKITDGPEETMQTE